MYGQDLGIAVTNASAKILMTEISRVMPNTILISSPQIKDDKNNYEDTGEYSIFVTDYNGYPSQITHVIKIGNGLYMDEEKAIHLGIDNKTIQFNGLNNQLYVDTGFLPKASSNNYGVVKITNEIERNNSLSTKSGISINTNGELYINDGFLNDLQLYINNQILNKLAPFLNTQSDIKLWNNYKKQFYYPYTLNEASIQEVNTRIINDSNIQYYGINNTIMLTSSISDQLDVKINIDCINGQYNLSKIKNLSLSTIIESDPSYDNIKIYNHIIKNLIFNFYPNLTNSNIEYNINIQVTHNIENEEIPELISDNVFKIMQLSISNNKNDIFTINNITIDENGTIKNINYSCDNLIYNYEGLFDSINLIINDNIKYKFNFTTYKFDLTSDTNIIDNSITTANWKLLYSPIENDSILKDININNGICNIIKNDITIIQYNLYEIINNNILKINDNINNSVTFDETKSVQSYKLELFFLNEDSYNQFNEKIRVNSNFIKFYINQYQLPESGPFNNINTVEITNQSIETNPQTNSINIEISFNNNSIHIPDLKFEINNEIYEFNKFGLDEGDYTNKIDWDNYQIKYILDSHKWQLDIMDDYNKYYNSNTIIGYLSENNYYTLVNVNNTNIDNNIILFKKISNDKYYKCIFPEGQKKVNQLSISWEGIEYNNGDCINDYNQLNLTQVDEQEITFIDRLTDEQKYGLLINDGINIYNGYQKIKNDLSIKYYKNNNTINDSNYIDEYYFGITDSSGNILSLSNYQKVYYIELTGIYYKDIGEVYNNNQHHSANTPGYLDHPTINIDTFFANNIGGMHSNLLKNKVSIIYFYHHDGYNDILNYYAAISNNGQDVYELDGKQYIYQIS